MLKWTDPEPWIPRSKAGEWLGGDARDAVTSLVAVTLVFSAVASGFIGLVR